MGGIEEVFLGVVVRGGGDDDIIGIGIGSPAVEGGGQVQRFLFQVLLDIIILNGTLPPVDSLHLFGDDVHGHDLVPLGQEGGDGKADVAGACYCDFHFLMP